MDHYEVVSYVMIIVYMSKVLSLHINIHLISYKPFRLSYENIKYNSICRDDKGSNIDWILQILNPTRT